MVDVRSARRPRGPQGLVRRVLASDLVDKLTAPHGVDRYLELVDPRWVVRESPAEVTVGVRRRDETETITPAPVDRAPDTPDGVVVFERALISAVAAGTLLETAEAAGLTPRFRCRRGICGTCTTTKTAGIVRNVATGQESSADAEPIRLCVSVACGDVAVDL